MDSREAFEKWCPYKGNPDPYTVWMECWPIAQAEAQQTIAGLQADIVRLNSVYVSAVKGRSDFRKSMSEHRENELSCAQELDEANATISGLQALIKDRDEALQDIKTHLPSNSPHAYRPFEQIEFLVKKALSQTSPTDALEKLLKAEYIRGRKSVPVKDIAF